MERYKRRWSVICERDVGSAWEWCQTNLHTSCDVPAPLNHLKTTVVDVARSIFAFAQNCVKNCVNRNRVLEVTFFLFSLFHFFLGCPCVLTRLQRNVTLPENSKSGGRAVGSTPLSESRSDKNFVFFFSFFCQLPLLPVF